MAEIDDINEGADDLKGTMSELRDVVKELAQALEKTASTAGDMAQALQDAAEGSEKNKDLTEEENDLLSDAEKLAKKLADQEERRRMIQDAGLQIGAAFLKQLIAVDDETSSIARRLNLSKEESTVLKQ